MSPARVVELLEAIDELPASASGALFFEGDDRRSGAVLVEAGRICWAVAGGMQQRLTDLIGAQLPEGFSRADLAELFRLSRAEKRPLGEVLVERSVMEKESFRHILRQHTTEAIALLCDEQHLAKRWQSHSRNRYDAAFTFSPAELLAAAGALVDPELATVAADCLQSASLDGAGVAFARLDGCAHAFPIGEVRSEELGVQSIVDLGRWAAGAIDVSDSFAQHTRVVMAARPDGQAIVAWRESGLLMTIVCEDRSSAAWAVARQNRRGAQSTSSAGSAGSEE